MKRFVFIGSFANGRRRQQSRRRRVSVASRRCADRIHKGKSLACRLGFHTSKFLLLIPAVSTGSVYSRKRPGSIFGRLGAAKSPTGAVPNPRNRLRARSRGGTSYECISKNLIGRGEFAAFAKALPSSGRPRSRPGRTWHIVRCRPSRQRLFRTCRRMNLDRSPNAIGFADAPMFARDGEM